LVDSDELAYKTIPELGALLRSRALSPMELLDATLARIKRRNPSLGAFVYLNEEYAYGQAKEAEQRLLAAERVEMQRIIAQERAELQAKRETMQKMLGERLAEIERAAAEDRATLEEDIRQNRPDIIVIDRVAFDWEAWARADPGLAEQLAAYRTAVSLERYVILQRR